MNKATVSQIDSVLAKRIVFNTDIELLQHDYSTLRNDYWPTHYNTRDFEGSWTSLALYSISGREDDIRSIPDQEYQSTSALSKCPAIATLLDQLKFIKESVRLLRLAPKSMIKQHRDQGLAYEFGCFRLHIPIVTSGAVKFVVNGEHIEMSAGECWYANFDLPHSVVNSGDNERVHLVIDGIRNEWTDSLFSNSGYDINYRPNKRYDEITKAAIREELKRMGGPVAQRLLDELENED